MREIKFRAWDKIQKRWGRILWAMEDCLYSESDTYCGGFDTARRFEFMQFTGLHDKNGKEIWEGDLIRYHKNKGIWTVEYQEGTFWFIEKNGRYMWNQLDTNKVEVIGNIYENPELK